MVPSYLCVNRIDSVLTMPSKYPVASGLELSTKQGRPEAFSVSAPNPDDVMRGNLSPLQGITGYRAARQGEPENQNFGFSGLLSHNIAIF
jgi:hypothetical protein